MKFFKPEDFKDSASALYPDDKCAEYIADAANAKLKREGKVVYSIGVESIDWWADKNPKHGRHVCKALLINIEAIEKCKHPVEKIRQLNWSAPDEKEAFTRGIRTIDEALFKCGCGAEVKPKQFEEI